MAPIQRLSDAFSETVDTKIDAHVIEVENLMKQGVRKSLVLLGLSAVLALMAIGAILTLPAACYLP